MLVCQVAEVAQPQGVAEPVLGTQDVIRDWHQSLARAGRRLDQASAAMREMCDPRYTALTEEGFALVEDEYLAAKANYMTILRALTGQSDREIEQRVMC
jgi:hypothetical protein